MAADWYKKAVEFELRPLPCEFELRPLPCAERGIGGWLSVALEGEI